MATFDPETALTTGGYDPRRAVVVDYAVQDDYAAARIDRQGDGQDVRLVLFRLTADGWGHRANGDAEAVSDGIAIAAWDAGSHRTVLGLMAEESEASPVPMHGRTRDRTVTLIWLTVLGAALWPAAAGAYVWEGASSSPALFVVQMTIGVVVAFLIVRNVLSLWRDPSVVTSRAYAGTLTGAGLLLLVISIGPLTDGRLASKPVGVVALVLGIDFLVLALREVARERHRRSIA